MIEYRVIDLNTYPRKAHLDLFMGMMYPQCCITAEVEVTELKRFCKKENCSFFLAFLHVVALAADSITELRQRIHRQDGEKLEIREYSQSPTSHTESADNEMYCYCSLFHHMPWKEYIAVAEEAQRKAREAPSLKENEESEAFYFTSCIPWIHYSEIIHPMIDRYDSNPRFSWGRYEEDAQGRLKMPLTIAVHHGLVDGLHIGKFYDHVNQYMAALAKGELDSLIQKGLMEELGNTD